MSEECIDRGFAYTGWRNGRYSLEPTRSNAESALPASDQWANVKTFGKSGKGSGFSAPC